MISIVYWENEFPTRYRLGLNLAMLLGSMLGQISLGYLADRLGRRKVSVHVCLIHSAAFESAYLGSLNTNPILLILDRGTLMLDRASEKAILTR